MAKPSFAYRIYFTSRPTTYLSLDGKDAKDAIRRAKQFGRSPYGRMTFGRGQLIVQKVERLLKNGQIKELKTLGSE